MFKYLSLLFTALLPFNISAKEIPPKECRNNCVTKYGTVLGSTKNGLKAYSNCNSKCVIFEPAHYKGTYTGIKWQCVEFARRWLLKTEGVVYGDVNFAYNIWDSITEYNAPKGNTPKAVKTKNIKNGEIEKISVGDLIIYSKDFLNTGHVAVVVEVENNKIKVAEENFSNKSWNGKHYSREINITYKNKKIRINDKFVLGIKVILN